MILDELDCSVINIKPTIRAASSRNGAVGMPTSARTTRFMDMWCTSEKPTNST
ncbi:MAG TPA: hypothetical protein VMW20_08675 [Candidatus Nanoarchaeia archaeon]|nr:hypothetical protein [Candidatus Nanoarchaeia archaeon]